MALVYSNDWSKSGSYVFSYTDVINRRLEFKRMDKTEFFTDSNIKQALHFAIYIGYIKEVSHEALNDDSAIHELSHWLCGIQSLKKKQLKKLFLKFTKL